MTNQELLDRYVQAIGFWLPGGKKSDIVAELSEDLRLQIAEREESAGRPLTGAELGTFLRERGNPLFVAGGYLPQRYLIGPALHPLYRFVLKLVGYGYLLPGIAVWAGLALFMPGYRSAHPGGELFRALLDWLWPNALYAFVVVTVWFAVLERLQVAEKWSKSWSLNGLPAVRDRLKIDRAASIGKLVAALVFALWWTGLIHFPRILLRAGATTLSWTGCGVWGGFHDHFLGPVLILTLMHGALNTVNLLRPFWTRLRLGIAVSVDAVCIATLALALKSNWGMYQNARVWLGGHAGSDPDALFVENCANVVCYWALAGAVLFCLGGALLGSWRLLRFHEWRKRDTQALGLLLLVLTFAGGRYCLTAGTTPQPSGMNLDERAIGDMLLQRIDGQHRGTGMVVGIVTPQGRRVISYGRLRVGDRSPLDGDTVFEIGSVTKIFTALLLADMVQRKEVSLEEPVALSLPKGVTVPEWHGQPIKLVDLATHTSGLPFFPTDFPNVDDMDAEMDNLSAYTPARLYAFLGHYSLLHEIGVHWEYSNLDYGLLGLALAERVHGGYASLLRMRVLTPVGLARTSIAPNAAMKSRLATGYRADSSPVSMTPVTNLPVLEAAGALHSCANDLLEFLSACMGERPTSLHPAMKAMLATTRPAADWLEYLGGRQALGWWIIGDGQDQIVAHSGQTPGFSCSLAYKPDSRLGVVALANCQTGGEDVALHLLKPEIPLSATNAAAIPAPQEISVDPAIFDRYSGCYQCAPHVIFVVRREGSRLTFMAPGSPRVRLRPQSERDYFINGADITVNFQMDDQNRAKGMILNMYGQLHIPAMRIPDIQS